MLFFFFFCLRLGREEKGPFSIYSFLSFYSTLTAGSILRIPVDSLQSLGNQLSQESWRRGEDEIERGDRGIILTVLMAASMHLWQCGQPLLSYILNLTLSHPNSSLNPNINCNLNLTLTLIFTSSTCSMNCTSGMKLSIRSMGYQRLKFALLNVY